MELRDYQQEIAQKGATILNNYGIVYLAMEVRTGKTLTALEIAKLHNAKNVLFLTKKKAITSILSDYSAFGYNYNLTVINNESMHKIDGDFDLVIHDESHRFGSFPKPSKNAKYFKTRFDKLPLILLSGTPTPESFSQIYHQLWISRKSPFKEWTNFYSWAKSFVTVKQKHLGYAKVNDYSDADKVQIDSYISKIMLRYTQKEAGFSSTIKECILGVQMNERTYNMVKTLKKDKLIQGKNEVILADTGAKEMQKIHQLFSGTIKFESGKTMILDTSKADFIKQHFEGKKIAIFYKFVAEPEMLKNVFGDSLTTEVDEFNETNKNIALQIVSGREGISLKAAEYIVYLNIDFSATSYWQSRDRMTTKDRQNNTVFWIFAENGIETKIYKAVHEKKNYTLKHYKND